MKAAAPKVAAASEGVSAIKRGTAVPAMANPVASPGDDAASERGAEGTATLGDAIACASTGEGERKSATAAKKQSNT